MDVAVIGSTRMDGEHEILGNTLHHFNFFRISSPEMNIDCSWNETILREKIVLTGSESPLNIRQLEYAFMCNGNGALKLFLWLENPLKSGKP